MAVVKEGPVASGGSSRIPCYLPGIGFASMQNESYKGHPEARQCVTVSDSLHAVESPACWVFQKCERMLRKTISTKSSWPERNGTCATYDKTIGRGLPKHNETHILPTCAMDSGNRATGSNVCHLGFIFL